MNFLPKLLRWLTFGLSALLLSLGAQAAVLETIFDGGNFTDGNMFDVLAGQVITINRFDVNVDSAAKDYEIYYRQGTWVGHDQSPADWTLLQSGALVSMGLSNATPIPLSTPLTLQANQDYAFYMTTKGAGKMHYTDGTAVGNLAASDAALKIFEGAGKGYPFATTFTPRIWNGRIHYTPSAPVVSPTAIPTLSQWGLLVMSGLMALFCIATLRKRRAP